MGFGFNFAVGRAAIVIMPFVVIPMAQSNPQLLSLLFMILSIIGALDMLMIPETLHQPLDGCV